MNLRRTLVIAFLVISGIANAQLTGITPNVAAHGQTLPTTITGNSIFIQTSSPSGNIFEISLIQGTDFITLFDFWNSPFMTTIVVDPNTVTTEVTIPLTVPDGLYDLRVITGDPFYPWMNQTTYSLPGAFTVSPPDGYVSGNVFDDLNRNGVKDGGEPGISNATIKLLPINITVVTNGIGDYSIPAQNGSYSVTIISGSNPFKFVSTANDTLSVTINNGNSSGNDFGLIDALVSVTPGIGYRGVTTLHQLVADRPIFIPGANSYGNISTFYVFATPTFAVPLNSINVIDSYTVQVNILVPPVTAVGSNIDIRIFTTAGYYGYHFLSDQFTIYDPYYNIGGRLFYDQNLNKINDPTDPGINFISVQTTPELVSAIPDNTGNFLMTSTGGVQTLAPVFNIPGLTLYTDSASFTFNVTVNSFGKDFGFISSLPDYSIHAYDLNFIPRCNAERNVSFKVRNNSNVSYDAIAWLKPDPLMTYISSNPAASSVSNDTVYWDISLDPFEEITLQTLCLMPGPNNQVTVFAGAISLDGNGVPQLSYQTERLMNITCSMDPNDKQVTPEGIFAQHFTLMSDTLEFQIRFQNTGNDTAYKVVVLDTLDAELNHATFEIIGSSHSMMTELKPDGALKFTFDNIMLPDSNVNEPESHGYIRYRIRAMAGLPDSTEINNTAHIYFDFNAPVVTNTTLNTLVFVLPVGMEENEGSMNVTLYPNPFSNSATLEFNNPSATKYQLTLTDVTGKVVRKEVSSDGSKFAIEKDGLREGLYFYQLVNTRTQQLHTGKLIIQ